MRVTITLEVRKGSKVLLRKHVRSFVRQFIDVMRIHMSQTAAEVKCTDGNLNLMPASSSHFKVNAAAGDASFGVQVGTGTNPVSISDYKLQTPISHGTGSGQLQYGAVSVGAVAVIPPSAEFTIARTFTNLSGADITVKEVGLTAKYDVYPYLLERTLLEFAIPNGENRTVTYKIKVTV
jgi:hypothetical protein